VRHFIEPHKEECDIVLWLDVQSVRLLGQATSDIVALGLPVEATMGDGILQGVAP
jgi:hypothetical protein